MSEWAITAFVFGGAVIVTLAVFGAMYLWQEHRREVDRRNEALARTIAGAVEKRIEVTVQKAAQRGVQIAIKYSADKGEGDPS